MSLKVMIRDKYQKTVTNTFSDGGKSDELLVTFFFCHNIKIVTISLVGLTNNFCHYMSLFL